MFEKIKKKILESSGSYNYYKSENVRLNDELSKSKELSLKLEEKDLEYTKILGGYHDLISAYKNENGRLKNELSLKIDGITSECTRLLDSQNELINNYRFENERLNEELSLKIAELNSENEKLKSALTKTKELAEKNNKTSSRYNRILDSHYKLFNLLLIEYELKPKGMLEQVQALTLEMMIFVQNICEKHDLNFWLDFGTLLGAVRHNGFIPWDDDIDLAMLRKDFDKFLMVFQEEINSLNVADKISITIDQIPRENLMISFIKINYGFIKLIDIFPYDFRDSAEGLTEQIYSDERNNFHLKLLNGESKDKVVEEYFKKLNLLYDDGKYIMHGAECVVGSYEINPFKIYEKNIIFPLKKIKFLDVEFPCPNNYDFYLKESYGEYKSIPKTIRHHNLLAKLRRRKNMEEFLAQAIILVNELNQNF